MTQIQQPNQQNGHGRAFWGPRLWYILHKISYKYPEKASLAEQQFYFSYYNLTRFMIPCPYCSIHYKNAMDIKFLHKNLNTRNEVIDWFRNLHNDVNLTKSGRVYQGFEVDMLYSGSEFNHEYFNQLLDYFYNLVSWNEIDRRAFIHWVLITFKVHPCQHCRLLSEQYFARNDIEKMAYHDNNILRGWLDGVKKYITQRG